MTEVLHSANNFQIYVEPWPLNSYLETANGNLEPEGCSLVSTICNTFPNQKISNKSLLSYLKMYTVDLLQLTPLMSKDPHVLLNSISSTHTCQELIHQMNYYTNLHCLCQLNQNQNKMIHALGQMHFLMNFYMELQLNSLIMNEKTRWILVNHLYLYISLLNSGMLHELLQKTHLVHYKSTYIFIWLENELWVLLL